MFVVLAAAGYGAGNVVRDKAFFLSRPQWPPWDPNDLWTADFKGHFTTRDGIYC